MIRIFKRRGTLLWSSSFCYVFFCSLPCGGGLAYLFICHCFAFLSFFCYCSRNIFFVQNLPIDKMFCLCIIAKSFSTLKYLHVDKNTLIYKNVSKYWSFYIPGVTVQTLRMQAGTGYLRVRCSVRRQGCETLILCGFTGFKFVNFYDIDIW